MGAVSVVSVIIIIIEAILRGKSPFGSVVLSAVRNREASASRRLTMYYSGSDFNPCHGLCPL